MGVPARSGPTLIDLQLWDTERLHRGLIPQVLGCQGPPVWSEASGCPHHTCCSQAEDPHRCPALATPQPPGSCLFTWSPVSAVLPTESVLFEILLQILCTLPIAPMHKGGIGDSQVDALNLAQKWPHQSGGNGHTCFQNLGPLLFFY